MKNTHTKSISLHPLQLIVELERIF